MSKLYIKLARLLPKKLVMRCFFQVMDHATTGRYATTIVHEITAFDAIDRYCKDNRI